MPGSWGYNYGPRSEAQRRAGAARASGSQSDSTYVPWRGTPAPSTPSQPRPGGNSGTVGAALLPGQGGTPGTGTVGSGGIAPTTGAIGSAAPAEPTGLSEVTASLLVNAILAQYGLGGVGLDALVMDLVMQGLTDPTLIMQIISQQPQYRERFPAMAMRQQQGLAPISAAEYVEFENFAAGLFQDFGLPPGFYDSREDFTEFIAQFPSLQQGRQSLQRRVEGGFVAVATAAPEIRDAFRSYFGVEAGDSALAAFFLDADRAVPVLEQQVELARLGGAATQFGFNLSLERADVLRGRSIGEGQARQGFAQVQDMAPLFSETIGEAGIDYTAENEGLSSVFRLDPNAVDNLRRRMEQRVAAFSGGGGFIRSQGGALSGLRVGR